jgi:PhnB protein
MKVHELYAYLCVANATAAIDFYGRAFGARELFRLVEPSGRVGHAELDFDGHTVMLCDEFPEYGIRAPAPGAGSPVTLHLHVDDADAAIARAVAAGATLERPASDAFYGERGGSVYDPFGHRWLLGHSIETVDPAEMQRRYDALLRQPPD